jgi:hypothetical protein
MHIELYQIAYSPRSLAEVEPGYRVLNNLSNERPDWYEYDPIRRFLLGHELQDDTHYGFFSPKFSRKTGLTHDRVLAHVQAAGAATDAVLFSPQPDMGAFFLNVYEQAETFDPGFIAAAQAWLQYAGLLNTDQVPLRGLVMDSRHIVFSNYFVAKPAFWREWLRFNESLHQLCEHGPESLRSLLIAPTTYSGGAQRKVFIQERTASLLLAVQAHWKTHPVNPFGMAWSRSRFSQHPQLAFMSDALKRAYRDLGHTSYIRAFGRLRERFLALGGATAPTTDPSEEDGSVSG